MHYEYTSQLAANLLLNGGVSQHLRQGLSVFLSQQSISVSNYTTRNQARLLGSWHANHTTLSTRQQTPLQSPCSQPGTSMAHCSVPTVSPHSNRSTSKNSQYSHQPIQFISLQFNWFDPSSMTSPHGPQSPSLAANSTRAIGQDGALYAQQGEHAAGAIAQTSSDKQSSH